MDTTWSFADEHLHWVLAHTPATRLLPLAAVARQWHAVVAELMRLRVSEGDGQRWCAAMACGPARDFSTKAKARPACLGLLSRATRHALGSMRMLPDLAIVFVSDATKHADAVAVLNPAVGTLDRHVRQHRHRHCALGAQHRHCVLGAGGRARCAAAALHARARRLCHGRPGAADGRTVTGCAQEEDPGAQHVRAHHRGRGRTLALTLALALTLTLTPTLVLTLALALALTLALALALALAPTVTPTLVLTLGLTSTLTLTTGGGLACRGSDAGDPAGSGPRLGVHWPDLTTAPAPGSSYCRPGGGPISLGRNPALRTEPAPCGRVVVAAGREACAASGAVAGAAVASERGAV